MTTREIEQRLKRIVVEKLGAEPEEVTRETHFRNDLGADSFKEIELIMDVEAEFNIHPEIPDDEFQNNSFTFEKLLKIVQKYAEF